MIRRPVLVAGLIALASMTGQSLAETVCDPARADLRGPWGQAGFSVEIAADPGSRARGLMFRENLGRYSGMLFIYDRPESPVFWMKNTPLPLDIVFIAPDGLVTRVHENAKPFDLTAIPGGDGVQYVLEVNAGTAAMFGIGPGTEMRHPAIAPGMARWPCDGAGE